MLPLRRRRVYWLCQLGGWGIYALLLFAFFTGAPSFSTALHCCLLAGLGVVQTHLLRRRIHSHGWKRLRLLPLLGRVLLSSMLAAAVLILVSIASCIHVLGLFTWHQVSVWVSTAYWVNFVILVVCWQLIYFGLHAMEQAARAELERLQVKALAQEAELRSLRSQLQPHFLFNCLNSLRTLIGEDPERARAMVNQLAGILRHALTPAEIPTVPLAEELSVVKDYLALESIRFEERLRVRMDVDPSALELPVPVLLLQGLVENGIKHGVSLLPEGGELGVSVRREEGLLQMCVRNSAPSRPSDPSQEGTGTGLKNARHQLRLLFGERATLALSCPRPGETAATVEIPLPT